MKRIVASCIFAALLAGVIGMTPASAKASCRVVATTQGGVCSYVAAGGPVTATIVGVAGEIAIYTPSGFLREAGACLVCYGFPMTVNTEPGDSVYLTVSTGVGRAQNGRGPIPIDN